MFVKLWKREWRSVRGILGLLCAIILGCGLVIGGVMHFMLRLEHTGIILSDLAAILCVLALAACVVGVAVCCAGSLFLLLWRFYKSRFTDEGYLTFTLPVTEHQILLSSFVNTIVCEGIVVLAALAAIGIAAGMFLLALPEYMLWEDMVMSLQNGLIQLKVSFMENWQGFVRLGISGIVASVCEILLLMLAITVGAIVAKKHKILTAVGVYYGIGVVQTFLYTSIGLRVIDVQDVYRLLSLPTLIGTVLAVVSYFLMHHLVSRKLNLQ